MIDRFTSLFPPHPARVHEACGSGATVFAACLFSALGGNALWLRERWQSERVNPAGFALYSDPKNILFAEPETHRDMLAVAEEALRSGALSLVVAETSQPLDLTAGRRLQLAAQAGETRGLLLIPEGMGSNAAETRWRCQPRFHDQDDTRQNWALIKNKSGQCGNWSLRWDPQARQIREISPAES
ncbi:MAG: hypothetical protein AAF415_01065 [Pseudomonadota bacterium]